MKHAVQIKIPNLKNITLELDDTYSPKTVSNFLKNLPFTVDLNVWGDEIYTSQSPISQPKENAKSTVELNDVAYWPTGKAICLFYGPTPIDNPDDITPASSVNVIGKIISPDKTILNDVHGECATFVLRS